MEAWKHALLLFGGLCWVVLVVVLILWDGKPPRCKTCRRRHIPAINCPPSSL